MQPLLPSMPNTAPAGTRSTCNGSFNATVASRPAFLVCMSMDWNVSFADTLRRNSASVISVLSAGNIPLTPYMLMVRSCPTAAPFFTVSFVNAPGIFPIAVPPVTMEPVVAVHSSTATAFSGIHMVSASASVPSEGLPLSFMSCRQPSDVAHQ